VNVAPEKIAAESRAFTLRQLLERVGGERGDHHEAGVDLDLRTGALLLKAQGADEVTLTEAAQLVGVTRPTAYRLMGEARKALAR
jgi:hypothetical protein